MELASRQGVDIAHLKSDVLHLENQNMSRHGEVMNILRRLEPIENFVDKRNRRRAAEA